MRAFAWWSVLALVALPAVVSAQRALPDEVTMEALDAIVRARAPALAVARAELGEIEGDRVEARLLPNPTFSFDVVRLASGENVNGVWQYDVRVDQPLPRPRVRGARTRAADRRRDAGELHREALAAWLLREARSAFVRIWAAQGQVEVLEHGLADLGDALERVRRRGAAGADSGFDLRRLELESRRLTVELERARRALDLERVELGRLIAQPAWRPIARATSLRAEPPTDAGGDLQARPSVRASAADVEAAGARLRAARAEARVAPTVSVAGLFTHQPRSAAILGGLSLPLPVFHRNQGEVRRAGAALEAAEIRAGAALAEANADLEAANVQRARALAALETLDDAMDARLVELRRMLDTGRATGAFDAFVVVEALRAIRELEATHVELEADLATADVELAYALGL